MKHNKLIAEFMGVYVITIDDVRKNKNPYISSADGYLEDDLKYHSSWDWLMPVVEKCLITDEPTEGHHCYINDSILTINIEVVYDRVVHFIKDYNTKRKDYEYLVLKSIMTRYGGLTNLICQLREDSDVAYVNIADDTNLVVNEDEVEDIINQLIR